MAMRKGESFLERTTFLISYFIQSIMPPFCSFERLDNFLRNRIKKNPKAYLSLISLADLYRFYNKNEEAMEKYLEVKQLGYMTDKDYLGFSEVLYRLKDYHGVIETMPPIIEKFPRGKNSNWYLAMSYFKINDFQKAADYFERVIKSGSKRCEDFWHLGSCYDSMGNLEKAKDSYLKALSIKPDSKELKQNLMLILIRIGRSLVDKDPIKAKTEFMRALDIDPNNQEAINGYVSLAVAYKENNELLKAKEICEEGIKQIGDQEQLLLCLSIVYGDLGEHDKEIDVNRKLLEITPNNVQQYLFLSVLEYKFGNKLKAKEILEKALNIAKDEKEQKEIKDKLSEWFKK